MDKNGWTEVRLLLCRATVLLSRDAGACIADVRLVHALLMKTHLSNSVVMGTWDYALPEMLSGMPA